jgi:hypothetical protein
MADTKSWVERIAAWRASGLTAKQFAEGKPFSAQQIWNWSWQLGKGEPRRRKSRLRPRRKEATVSAANKGVRLVRVVAVRPATQSATGFVVDVRGIRISVPTGFDRTTFSAVLDEVERRGLRGHQS